MKCELNSITVPNKPLRNPPYLTIRLHDYLTNRQIPYIILLNFDYNYPMPILSLTTDFGTADGFVGVMKGVIWGICPDAHIADITHSVPPQDVRSGAYALWRAIPFFPPNSVHVAVIDPGVGTERRAIAMHIKDQYLVAPDNGLLTPILETSEKNGYSIEMVHLNKPKFWLPHVSRTFHGRDIFAPCGAHLAAGVPLHEMGDPIDDPFRLALPHPEKTFNGWIAHVTVIDTFGNLTTDLPADALNPASSVMIKIRGRVIEGLVFSYGHRKKGDLVALVDSENYIEIAVVNGSAAKATGARIGDPVEVILHA